MQNNSTLLSLCFTDNNISNKGTEYIKELFQNNSNIAIEELHLSCTNIGDDGAHQIAALLKNNNTLTTLYMSNTNITEIGFNCLDKAIQDHPSLSCVYVDVRNTGVVATTEHE